MSRIYTEVTTSLRRAAFQYRLFGWMIACFGEKITFDKSERNHRFLEESLETVQSLGCTRKEAHALVDYVFDRKVGDPKQEVGGAYVTLCALCIANGFDFEDLGETELARIWTKIEQIREKHKTKPQSSPYPQKPNGYHPSHHLQDDDSPYYNFICVRCGNRDTMIGPGLLSKVCPCEM